MATLYKADGSIESVFPAEGDEFTLAELQKLVGGDIEVVKLSTPGAKNSFLVVNEEGLIHGLPPNKRASIIAGTFIVGDAVCCGAQEIS